jgi:cysteinyl-tRNA synthetase
MTDVLGVDPFDPGWVSTGSGEDDAARQALNTLVRERLAARATARAEKDFAAADAVRDLLTAAGILVEDTPSGARWSLGRPVDSPAVAGQAHGQKGKR